MSIHDVVKGLSKGVYIIAEIGVNHNGSLQLALEMIDRAVECGADAVKFQTFNSDKLVTPSAEKAKYQIANGTGDESQLAMLKKLELTFKDFRTIKDYCDNKNVDFLSTPFDEESADFLYSLNVNGFKVGSGDMNNIPLLRRLDQYRLPIILSTGMATLEEVQESLDSLLYSKVAILHCTSEYPAPLEEVNLLAMKTMESSFQRIIGFSDHTVGSEAAISAVALGAKIIEKHLTLDRNLPGPDHRASMEPEEFTQMVKSIRKTELLLGDGIKRTMPSEVNTKKVARKSIVTTRKLCIGEIITESDLNLKRPGDGIEPKFIYQLIGKKVVREVDKDQCLSWDDVE